MYARVNIVSDVVESQIGWLPEGMGPYPEPPDGEEGVAYFPLTASLNWGGRPSTTSVLKWNDGEPVWEETLSLESLKAVKNAEIDMSRAAANKTYFDFQGKRVACDDLSWKDIISANAEIALTREMPEDWPGGWKTMDKSFVLIPDVATWTLFIKAMVNRGTVHFKRSQQLKSLLAAAETPEQIAAIKWETPNV